MAQLLAGGAQLGGRRLSKMIEGEVTDEVYESVRSYGIQAGLRGVAAAARALWALALDSDQGVHVPRLEHPARLLCVPVDPMLADRVREFRGGEKMSGTVRALCALGLRLAGQPVAAPAITPLAQPGAILEASERAPHSEGNRLAAAAALAGRAPYQAAKCPSCGVTGRPDQGCRCGLMQEERAKWEARRPTPAIPPPAARPLTPEEVSDLEAERERSPAELAAKAAVGAPEPADPEDLACRSAEPGCPTCGRELVPGVICLCKQEGAGQ